VERAVLFQITPANLQELLPTFLAQRIEDGSAERVAAHVAGWGPAHYERLLEQLRALGCEHRVYDALPHCRELARAWLAEVLDTRVHGVEHLAAATEQGRTIIMTNHVSYVDAVATDFALATAGHRDLADRIVYLAGPKVYQELFRLVAAASIHSLPVPQSTQFAHTENLSVRELARRAMSSLEAGQQALAEGKILLFYPEGSRTRSGRMGSFLAATRRYVQAADVVVPASIVGTERVMPLDTTTMMRGRVTLTFGAPIAVEEDDGRRARDVLAQAHAAVAALLPPELAPEDGTSALV
jgi:1-acyl-sn-glycerol-3-phosphate acyltransferase